jgi:hypothetical protein
MTLAALLLSVATGSISVIGAIYMMLLKIHEKIDTRTSELKITLVENQGEIKTLSYRVEKLEDMNKTELVDISGLKFAIEQMPFCRVETPAPGSATIANH